VIVNEVVPGAPAPRAIWSRRSAGGISGKHSGRLTSLAAGASYRIISFEVTRHSHGFGLRMALASQRGDPRDGHGVASDG
jgi:hypothetical protein